MSIFQHLRLRLQLKRLERDFVRKLIASDFYRVHASALLEELGDHQACIQHCESYLMTASSDVMIGRLAHCYGEIGEWEKSADTYRTMGDLWKEPMDALGYALAELRCGNQKKTMEILDVVELAHGHRSGPVEALIRQLRSELYWANDREN